MRFIREYRKLTGRKGVVAAVPEGKTKGVWSKIWGNIASTWEETTGSEKDKDKNRLLAFPIIFLFVYYLISLILYRFYNPPDPGANSAVWNGWKPWGGNPGLFFVFIPLACLITAWVWKLRKKVITLLALVALFLLFKTAYTKYDEIDSGKQSSAETRAQKTRITQSRQNRNGHPFNIITKPDEWSNAVEIPPGYKCTYQEEGSVFVRPNRNESEVFLDTPEGEDRHLPGRGTSFEFKSANNEEVIVTITLSKL